MNAETQWRKVISLCSAMAVPSPILYLQAKPAWVFSTKVEP